MAIPEDRMSTTPVPGEWLTPDERGREWREDYEGGPLALSDPSKGLNFQVWHLTWDSGTGDFTCTPETQGAAGVITNAANVTQCSLAFDQNGRATIAYTSNGQAYLYWYDTDAAGFVTTALDSDVVNPQLSLDDKRATQTSASDILLWYTRQQPDTTWNLYKREQRERFQTEDLMAQDVYPYAYKAGMNNGLRGQIALRYSL